MGVRNKDERMVVCDTVLLDIMPGGRGIVRKAATLGRRLPRSEFERLVALPINRGAKAHIEEQPKPGPAEQAKPQVLAELRTPALVIMAKRLGLRVPPRTDRDELTAMIEAATSSPAPKPLAKMNRAELMAVVEADDTVVLSEVDDTNKKIRAAIERARQAK